VNSDFVALVDADALGEKIAILRRECEMPRSPYFGSQCSFQAPDIMRISEGKIGG